MSTAEIKTNLHKIIDRIEDERLLRVIYDFLEVREKSTEGQLWKTLTAEQQQEVIQAFEDSEDDAKLIDDKDFWQMYALSRGTRRPKTHGLTDYEDNINYCFHCAHHMHFVYAVVYSRQGSHS